MVSYPTPQNVAFNTFGGIRLRNGAASNGLMTATICKNIDFIPQGLSSNVKIQTSKGNTQQAKLDDYKIIKGFETEQDGTKYLLVYAEDTTEGIIAKLNNNNTFTTLVSGLSITGKANAITMVDGAYDVCIVTNGLEYYKISFEETQQVTQITPTYEEEDVTGLAIAEQDGALVIASPKGYVISSRKGDIADWDYVTPGADDENKPWYQTFGKPLTAIVPYFGGLLVFSAEDSTILKGNFSTASTAVRESASLGGCFSFESWILHDKYLFFYDNTQKNIYYFAQNDYGQTKLGDPVAIEVQKMFDDISKFQFCSYIANNRNEIWILTNDKQHTNDYKFILDYSVKEWTQRECQKDITSYFTFNNEIYSTTESGKILREKDGLMGYYGYVDSNNKGDFYGSEYAMQTINFGSYSNLKEMELPPVITVTNDYPNNFWLYALVNDKKLKSKLLQNRGNDYGTFWGSGESQDKNKWDLALFAPDLSSFTHQLKGKQISNFYTVKFTIQTSSPDQSFSISAVELKGITQETDTMGHK